MIFSAGELSASLELRWRARLARHADADAARSTMMIRSLRNHLHRAISARDAVSH